MSLLAKSAPKTSKLSTLAALDSLRPIMDKCKASEGDQEVQDYYVSPRRREMHMASASFAEDFYVQHAVAREQGHQSLAPEFIEQEVQAAQSELEKSKEVFFQRLESRLGNLYTAVFATVIEFDESVNAFLESRSGTPKNYLRIILASPRAHSDDDELWSVLFSGYHKQVKIWRDNLRSKGSVDILNSNLRKIGNDFYEFVEVVLGIFLDDKFPVDGIGLEIREPIMFGQSAAFCMNIQTVILGLHILSSGNYCHFAMMHEIAHALSSLGLYKTGPVRLGDEFKRLASDGPKDKMHRAQFPEAGYDPDSHIVYAVFRSGLCFLVPRTVNEGDGEEIKMVNVNYWLNEAVTHTLTLEYIKYRYMGRISPQDQKIQDEVYKDERDIFELMVAKMQREFDNEGRDINVRRVVYEAYFERYTSKDPKQRCQGYRRLSRLIREVFDNRFLFKIDGIMREKKYDQAKAYIESF